MTEDLRQGFQMGDLTVLPSEGRIRGPGGTQHVPPKVMDVLVALAARSGQVVDRDTIIADVWNQRFTSDEGLTRCISELRQLLKDQSDQPRYIRTVPKRGYQLIANISEIPDRQASTLPESSSVDRPGAGSLAEFFRELQRRRVIRVGLVYLIAAWLIIQVSQATFPALLLPDWSLTLVVILCVLGFPIALILAWAYQVQTEGTDPTATQIRYVTDRKRKFDFLVIAALGGLVAILAYRLYGTDAVPDPFDEPGSIATEQHQSIGVLPFVNLSDDPDNEYFADGLAEEILNLLVRVKEVDVASRTSSFYFRGKNVDIKDVASVLGVGNVLEGSVRRQGNSIRVTAQLFNGNSGFQLWSNTYDRELQDIFKIQDDIARQVVNALEIVISAESDALLEKTPTESLEAFEFYLQGRDYLRGDRSDTELESARLLFDRATRLDSNFAEAFAGLCDTYLALYRRSRATGDFEEAERACHRGLTLDAEAGDVYTALGNLYLTSGQYNLSESEFNKAIALNSFDIDAISGLARTYREQNRLDEAERSYMRLVDTQPGYWRAYLELGRFYYYAGRNSDAVEAFRRVVELAPDSSIGHLNLGSTYYLQGDFESAADAWIRSIELEPSSSAYLNVGSSYFFLGRLADAAEMYETAVELSPNDFEGWGALGDARYYAGDQPGAEVAYARAIELGEEMLRINPANALTMAPLSQYYAKMGDRSRAILLMERAEEAAPDNMYVHYFTAVTSVSLKNHKRALQELEKAVQFGYPRTLLALDAGLAKLAEEPEFKALIEIANQ